MEKNDCTIMVCSCDKYSDLWMPFFELFKVYWKDCPYEIMLNTESKSFSMEGLNIHCLNLYKENEKVPYGKRMLAHLREVKTPYVLIILDDFFILDYVDTSRVQKVVNYLKENDKIAMFKLSPNIDTNNIDDDRYPEFEKRPRIGYYRHSLQTAIWSKDAFEKTWKKGQDPWNWEIWGTYKSLNDGWDYYCLKENETPIIDYGYDYYNGGSINVLRGKWTHGRYEEVLKKNNIKINFEERGWYKDEKMPGTNESFFKKEKSRLISAGGWMYTKIFFWRMARFFKCKLGIPVNQTYMGYLKKEKKEIMKVYHF